MTISKGDKVEAVNPESSLYYAEGERTVRAVDGKYAWVARESESNAPGGIIPLEHLQKVEPKFEVGKVYTRQGANGFRYRVIDKMGRAAIGWKEDGGSGVSSWHTYDEYRRQYTEVSDGE